MILELLKDFNDNYAKAVQDLTPFVLGVVSWVYYKLYKESKLKEGDAALIVKPVFWTLGRKYKILAAHEYQESDDSSGYIHLGQNSRPDQWEKLINIQSSFLNLRHKIILKCATKNYVKSRGSFAPAKCLELQGPASRGCP